MTRGDIPCCAMTPVRNGGPLFERCLRSGLFCREHVILDGGSTDGTLDLAARYGCRIVRQDPAFLDESGRIINFGGIVTQGFMEARSQEWLLLLAADEELSDELIASMTDVIRAREKGAYYVNRYFLLDGRPVPHASMSPDHQIRLCHREAILGFKKVVHERPVLAPGVTPRLLENGSQYLPLTQTPAELRQKYRRYLDLEKRRFDTFGWLQWISYALRRVLVTGMLLGRMSWFRVRYPWRSCLPLRYEFVNIWYNWQLIRRSCPAYRMTA